MDKEKEGVEAGDLIQVIPDGKWLEHQDGFWAGRVLVVDEPKAFGCVAFASLEQGDAYIRLSREDYVRVGRLHFMPSCEE